MIRNVWDGDYDNIKNLPTVTPELVKEAEQLFGVTLPPSYIELCSIQNGGYLKYDAYPTSVPTGWADDHVSVDHLRGIGKEGIFDNQYYIDEWELPENIILLCGDGYWWIALDYRKTKENPPIIYVDLEYGEDTFILELAPNFDTFINGLMVYED